MDRCLEATNKFDSSGSRITESRLKTSRKESNHGFTSSSSRGSYHSDSFNMTNENGQIHQDPNAEVSVTQLWFWIERLRGKVAEVKKSSEHLDRNTHKVRNKEPILRHDESPDNPYAKLYMLQKKKYVPNITKIRTKVIVIAGLGSVGATIAEHLGRAGVGKLLLVDKSRVTPANLGSLFFCPKHVGHNKVDCVISEIKSINPDVVCKGFVGDVSEIFHKSEEYSSAETNLLSSEPIIDVVVSCLDSYESRISIAEYCRRKKLILIDAFVSCSATHSSIRVNSDLKAQDVKEEAKADESALFATGTQEVAADTRSSGRTIHPSSGNSANPTRVYRTNYGCPVHLGSTEAVVAGLVIQQIAKLLLVQIQPPKKTTYNALNDRFEVLPNSYKPT